MENVRRPCFQLAPQVPPHSRGLQKTDRFLHLEALWNGEPEDLRLRGKQVRISLFAAKTGHGARRIGRRNAAGQQGGILRHAASMQTDNRHAHTGCPLPGFLIQAKRLFPA